MTHFAEGAESYEECAALAIRGDLDAALRLPSVARKALDDARSQFANTHTGDATPFYTGNTAEQLKATKRESLLQEAHRLVNGPRQNDYGHPLDDFTKTAQMWSAIFGVGVTAEQVALAMVCVKLSRLLNTPTHHDSQVDIAGYIQTYAMVVEERRRRGAA